MWKVLKLFLGLLSVIICSGIAEAKGKFSNATGKLYFIENKGQIKDQDGNARQDIQYAVQAPGLTIFIGNGKLHYQFTKGEVYNVHPSSAHSSKYADIDLLLQTSKVADLPKYKTVTYRMDAELIGANDNAETSAAEPQDYYENYYTPGCPENGIRVHTYKKVTYKNIYPGIDWIIYIKGDHLEYEFAVGPGGDASQIKLKYNGQTSLKVNVDGSITATTPMGIIKEKAPVCYQGNSSNTFSRDNLIASAYKVRDNILSYKTKKNNSIIIDPTLEWGTYYGEDTLYSPLFSIAVDSFAHIYGCGFSWSNTPGLIATTGSFQDTLGGESDAFLVKFDSSGNRLWATYYGGSGEDYGFGVGCDAFGNVYMGGATFSMNNIATPGTQETSWLWVTQNVGFLAKFDSTGARQWATYVGGSNGATFDLEIYSVCCDLFGNVYASGSTDDTSNVGTPGTFKPYKHEGDADTSIDCFLIQYNATTGLENWGTYYGNLHTNFNGASYVAGENIYLTGYTNCAIDSDITTPGSYQPTFAGGSSDAFLVDFNTSNGQRVWGTYYGGTGDENTGGVACDANGNIYLFGTTTSDSDIASPGCYQPLNAGAYDVFLAAFTPSGSRLWATYYGGPGIEYCHTGGLVAAGGYLYIAGGTASDTGIASTCSWQPVYGGGSEDAFLARFNDSDGYLVWATYYGGSDEDEGRSCAFDGKSVYLSGKTSSINNIATAGSFDPSGGGGTQYQGFLAKFDLTYYLQAISGISHVCLGDTVSLTDSTSGGTWSCSSGIVTIGSSTGMVIGIDSGTTIITYTTPNGCFVTMSDTVIKCWPVNISPVINKNFVTIYPDPAFDQLTINTGASPGYQSFFINNSIGQQVLSGKITSTTTIINVQLLPQGVYFLTLYSNAGTSVREFLKE